MGDTPTPTMPVDAMPAHSAYGAKLPPTLLSACTHPGSPGGTEDIESATDDHSDADHAEDEALLHALLDGLEAEVVEARRWPFQYGAALTACVWASVWQTFEWASTSPALYDCLLIRLGRLRVGATAAARLRDDWVQRGVHRRGALAYLRRGVTQEQAATPTLLGDIPRPALAALVTEHAALVTVDCLAGCTVAEPTGEVDPYTESPIGPLTEPLTAVSGDTGGITDTTPSRPPTEDVVAAEALRAHLLSTYRRTEATDWLRQALWLFLPERSPRRGAPDRKHSLKAVG